MYNVNDTDISIDITIVDDTGLPVTGLVAATMPTIKFSKGSGADVTVTLSDLSALTDAHSDGGVKERGEGVYRLDLPDSVATTAGIIKIRGESTNKRVIAGDLIIGGKIASVSGAVNSVTTGVTLANDAISSSKIADGAFTAAKFASDVFDAVWSVSSRTLSAFAFTPNIGGLETQAKADVNAEVDTALADAGITTTRTTYLDKLNISGNVASSSEVTAIQNNTRIVRVVPAVVERPDSGTTIYRVELFLYDETGNMEAPDSAPTIDLVNQSGTSRTSRLDSTTMTLVETGRYRAIYTASSTDDIEQLVWTFTVVEGGATRKYGNDSLIVDTTAVDFTSSDRTNLNTLASRVDMVLSDVNTNVSNTLTAVNTKPSLVQIRTEVDDAFVDYDAATGTDVSTAQTAIIDTLPTAAENATAVRSELTTELGRIDTPLSTISGNVTAVLNRLGAWTGSGINTVLGAFRALMAKASALTPTDISSGTTYDNTTDSLEAQSDLVQGIDSVTDKLNTMVELDGSVYRFTTNAVEQAPSGGGGGITGDYPVSMTVEDDEGNAVSIKFNVLTSAGTMVGSSVTNTLGEEEFSLSTGDYKITFPLNHIYEDHADVTFSVGTSSVTIPTIVLNRKVLSPAIDPVKTNVYFVLKDINGPIVNGSVEYQLDQNCFAEDVVLSSKKYIVYSGSDGIATATMFRYSSITKGTGIYKITIKDADGTVIHDVRRRIKTDQAAVYFEDLHD